MAMKSPKKLSSSSKKTKKGLRCTVQMDLQAITCPGVVLASDDDVYLSVCVMGQFRKTECVPPVFPLLFHHKMLFVKTFSGAVDPGDIADLLEEDTTTFELIQLVPPVGEVLATVAENSRDFLYPAPKLTPRVRGPEREILMTRASSFPGISPKVEFATTSTIEDCDRTSTIEDCDRTPVSSPGHRSPAPAHGQPARETAGSPPGRGQRGRQPIGYGRPTVASQSRAPSPYTRRRMCQLSEDACQRLAHLGLGPYQFRKETEAHTPFLVPRSLSASLLQSPSSPPSPSPHRLSSSSSPRPSLRHSRSPSAPLDSSLTGSYRPKSARDGKIQLSPRRSSRTPAKATRPARSPPRSKDPSTPVRASVAGLARSSPGSGPGSPLICHSSLTERFRSVPSSPSHWEEIHSRVQNILHTNAAARRRRSLDEGRSLSRRSCEESLCDNQPHLDRDPSRETSVHLDNGTFWTNQAATYTGKPHRVVFEDSLERIYKNMYSNL